MRAVTTAGERVLVHCSIKWLSALLADAAAGELSEAATSDETVRLQIQADRRPFDRDGWALIGRGAWASSPRALIEDACSSHADRCCMSWHATVPRRAHESPICCSSRGSSC